VMQTDFGSLFQFIRNGMNVKQDKSGDGLPITRIETISDATVDANRVGYAGLGEQDCKDWLLQQGDILFSHINSVEHIGKCAVYEGMPHQLVHGMNLLCLRCDQDNLLPQFAKYLIRGPEFRSRLSNYINKAVNQASVSIGNLKTIPVSVPPLPEQRRIAAILDKADALRAKRREALAQLDELTQSIFIEKFGDPASNPNDWPILPFESQFKSVRYGTGSPPPYVENGIPFIRATNIKNGRISDKELRHITPESAQMLAKCRVNSGNIIIVRSGVNTGDCAVIPEDYEGACAAFDLIVDIAYPESMFYGFLLNSDYGQRILEPLTRRAAQPHLNAEQIQNLQLIVPPKQLKEEFSKFLVAVDTVRQTKSNELFELDCLFNSLQHRAFRGEL